MNELNITYWDLDDGSVGAKIANVEGDIWASDAETLFCSIHALCAAIEKESQRALAQGTPHMVDMGMRGQWIRGEYLVGFRTLPNFGVSFANEEKLATWIAHLVKTVVTPQTIKTHD